MFPVAHILLFLLLLLLGHVVAQLVEALRYMSEVACSIPDDVTGIFH
jgi:hypothetical protein